MARTATRKKKQLTLTQRFTRWCFSPFRLCVAALTVMLWIFVPKWGAMLPDLRDQQAYFVTSEQIHVTAAPAWIPEDITRNVLQRAGFQEPLSLLDARLSEKVAFAFHTHPWVERLQQVKKSYPARIVVDVIYRKPVALVEVAGGGYFPVDRHGVLLPDEDFRAADRQRYPIVRGVQTAPLGYIGEEWGDPAVTGAAALADRLTLPSDSGRSWWQALELQSIIVPDQLVADNDLEAIQFQFETQGGSVINWGRIPGTRHPGELSVDQKLERLAEYHRAFNGLDSGPSPVRIDIRHWQGTRRSLLAVDPAQSTRR